jgi:hypothetical protein
MTRQSNLAVLVDGKPMEDDQARALWERFSRYLDEHRLDFAGFAKSEGYADVRPESRGGRALLIVTTHGAAAPRGGSNSGSRHPGA